MNRTSMPTSALPFVGRTRELAEVTARLASGDCRLLTITGIGGSGKTRLASEAARLLEAQFSHGTAFVDLQALAQSKLLVGAIARTLGMSFNGSAEPFDQLLEFLQNKTLLLVLDNFEHLLDGADLIDMLLACAPGVKVLATSREALNLQAEWLYPLQGLSVPSSVYVASLDDYEAARLFLLHARRVRPDFDAASEHKAIVRICSLAAGLPLAIELAAAWLKGLSAAQIAGAMQHNLDFLATSARNAEQRHRSMRAVFEQSWQLLAGEEAQAFARLSVFAGGFDSDAAEQVAGASLAVLAALVEKSLVQRVAGNRFGLHEMLRQYANLKLDELGKQAATLARHSAYFAGWMRQQETELQQARQLAALQAIERDFENVRMAWEWAAQHQISSLYQMLNGLYLFGFLRGLYRETIPMFEQGLAQAGGDEVLRSLLLVRRWGYLHWMYQAEHAAVLVAIDGALAVAEHENNRFEMAFCHLVSAYVLISAQRYVETLPHLHASRELFEAIGMRYYVCWVLHRIGFVYYNLNDSHRANDYTEQGLQLARETHNTTALVICLYNRGSDYILSGDYAPGLRYCNEALEIASEMGHRDQIAYALSLLALHDFCSGDYLACQEHAQHSREIMEAINSRVFEPYNRALLIVLACLREDYAEGMRLHTLLSYQSTNKIAMQLYSWALATLFCGLGSVPQARAALEQVLRRSNLVANAAILVWIAPCAAFVLAETEPETAIRLLGWACAAPNIGHSWARDWPLAERLAALLQAQFGSAGYAALWEAGAALPSSAVAVLLERALSAGIVPATAGPAAISPFLTFREREILALLAAGLTNPQIAAQLVIGAGTVKTHTLNIYRKLDVANRTQAIMRAQELGLLKP